MSIRNLKARGGGALAQVLSAGEAAALRHPEIVAAFWPRAANGTKRIAASRIESIDVVDPSRIWRTVSTAAPIVTINKTLARDAYLYRIGDGAIGDLRLRDRSSGQEVALGINPKRTGGFSVVQAIRYEEQAFARSANVTDGARDIYMGPRGFTNNRWYVAYDPINTTTSGDFLLQGTQAMPELTHVAWWSCDWSDGSLYTGADTHDPASARSFNKTVTPASDLPKTIENLHVASRFNARIDDCFIGPTIFIAAPIHRLQHKVLRESLIGAVASAVGVTLA